MDDFKQLIIPKDFFEKKQEVTEILEPCADEDTAENDFEKVRKASMKALDVAQKSLDEIEGIAYSSQDIDAYDTLYRSIKTISDVSKTILELSEKRKTLSISKEKNKDADPSKVVNNNLFVGSTKEFAELIKSYS